MVVHLTQTDQHGQRREEELEEKPVEKVNLSYLRRKGATVVDSQSPIFQTHCPGFRNGPVMF